MRGMLQEGYTSKKQLWTPSNVALICFCPLCASKLVIEERHYLCPECGAIIRRFGSRVTVEFTYEGKRYILSMEIKRKVGKYLYEKNKAKKHKRNTQR